MSSMPGEAVATTSMMPRDASRLVTRESPWVSRYSASAAVADSCCTSTSGSRRAERGLAVELDHQHPKSSTDCRTRQNCGYGGLPNATLAGHDGHLGGGEELQRIHALRRHLCAD